MGNALSSTYNDAKAFVSEQPPKVLVSIGAATAAGVLVIIVLKRRAECGKSKYPSEVQGFSVAEFVKNPEEWLIEFKTRHPNECTVNLGRQFFFTCERKMIVLNSMEAVRKFSKAESGGSVDENYLGPIANRPQNFALRLVSKNYLGSFLRMGDKKIKEVQKYTLEGLHHVVSKTDFETRLNQEVDELVKFFAEQKHIEDVAIHLQQFAANVAFELAIGARFPYDLNTNATIKNEIRHMTTILTSLNMAQLTTFHHLDALLTQASFAKYVASIVQSIYSFLDGAVGSYAKNNYDSEVMHTLADFLIKKQAEKEKANHGQPLAHDEPYSAADISVQVFTVFLAASGTTGFTLSWALYYLSLNPAIQEEIFQEIEANVGSTGAAINLQQRAKLPRVEACVMETLRLSATQTLIPRATSAKKGSCKTRIDDGKYEISANTPVLINIYAMHRDPKYWGDTPEEFKLDRWLDSDGKFKGGHVDSFLPFGIAPRRCLGDSLAKNLLFLMIANLVQRFQFEYVSGGNPKQLTMGVLGLMRCPHKFSVNIKQRK